MKRTFCCAAAIILGLLAAVVPARADLDLEQEVLIIPDTHNEKPYIWHVARNPRGYDLNLSWSGTEGKFILSIGRDRPAALSDLHVFVADHDLHSFAHRRPEAISNAAYAFDFVPTRDGRYRFEIVFRTDVGWVNLRKDLELSGSGRKKDADDSDYAASVKPIPKNAYADHVTTFLYELAYQGSPLSDLERIDGVDMVLASWDEDLREFIFATPRQNLGGPKVAVSVVFGKPGRHAVFSEFRHRGRTQTVEFFLNVLAEPNSDPYSIENLKPAD